MTRKLIVLDRDGVINYDADDFVKTPAEWRAIPGSLEAVARLWRRGYQVCVATNQSGVGRGLYDYHDLAAIHGKMLRHLAALGGRIDGIFFCPHSPDAGCTCRKPASGLYADIERYFGRSVKDVPSIGDTARDLEAALAAGARPILVRTGNGRDTEATLDPATQIPVYDDLAAAVAALVDA